jgi:aspartate-semialdehyde dehydrogenase
MSTNGLVVAIVGVTGAVGDEMRSVLVERRFPVSKLVPLASERSAGQTIEWRGEDCVVQVLDETSFNGVDIALFSAGGAISQKYAPIATASGCYVVDNSSAFRMDPAVPLVVPEVNPADLAHDSMIIANPNCSTIQEVVALQPLHELGGLKRVVASTYQSASGAGREGMDELRDQTVDLLNFREPKNKTFSRRLAFDTIPQIDVFQEDGFTKEEHKMMFETRKIMGLPELQVCATCVRVPVFLGHAMAINAEFERPITAEQALNALENAHGVVVHREPSDFPVAADVQGADEVHIGRMRIDPSAPNALAFWVVADNLRKGAATNAVQIAELLKVAGRFDA